MARVLKHNVTLRKNPPTGEIVTLLSGQNLPDWAEGMVGDHLFTDEPTPVKAKPADKPLPREPEKELEEVEKVEMPDKGAHISKWRKFAESLGMKVAKGTTRDEIQGMVFSQYPDLDNED